MQVVRKRLEEEEEEDIPMDRRPTALARSYYLKVRLAAALKYTEGTLTYSTPGTL